MQKLIDQYDLGTNIWEDILWGKLSTKSAKKYIFSSRWQEKNRKCFISGTKLPSVYNCMFSELSVASLGEAGADRPR